MSPTVLDHQPITASEEDRPALIKLEDLFDHLAHIPHFNFYNRYLDSFVTRLSDKYASKKRN